MERAKLLVTRRWPDRVEAAMKERFDTVINKSDRPMSKDALRQALGEVDAVLPAVTDCLDGSVFDTKQVRTRLVADHGALIDLDAARSRGIQVTSVRDTSGARTADNAMLLLMMLAQRNALGGASGGGIEGRTLGLLGFGRVGQQVAKRAAGFGLDILSYDKMVMDPEVYRLRGVRQAESFEQLLAEADFLSLHCPPEYGNRQIVDAARLNRMKPTASLIITAGAALVDEEALAHALWFETIGGAGITTTTADGRLQSLCDDSPNAVLLPTESSPAERNRETLGLDLIAQIEGFFGGMGKVPHYHA